MKASKAMEKVGQQKVHLQGRNLTLLLSDGWLKQLLLVATSQSRERPVNRTAQSLCHPSPYGISISTRTPNTRQTYNEG